MIQNVFADMFRGAPFSDVYSDINTYTAGLLKNYLGHIRLDHIRKDLGKNRKEIYDAVWGSIEFTSAEMVIIDSPLLQRLKMIRQLGLSDFVYPGSTYSRFCHTLGVTSLSTRMAKVINRILDEEHRLFPEKKRKALCQLVRYAAIFHDVGHTLYSHASEKFFAESDSARLFDTVSKMQRIFSEKTRCETALHELIACMIVNSDAVKEMMEISLSIPEGEQIEGPLDQHLEYITCLIVGVPVDKYILPFSKIINGPIDSDKCDYLTRDSHVTKIPVAVDIFRLINKLRLVAVEAKKISLPEIWNDPDTDSSPYLELAVTSSAEKTLFQLCMARNIMYGSVYYHQKVLTAETALRDVLRKYQDLFPEALSVFSKILELSDDFLGPLMIQWLRNHAETEENQEQQSKLLILAEKMESLLNRSLCKRVLSLTFPYLLGDKTRTKIFGREIIEATDPRKRECMLSHITAEYIEIYKKKNNMEPTDVDIYLVHQPMEEYDPKRINVHIDLGRGPRNYRGYSYLESKESNDKQYLLVTNQHDRVLLMLAAEKALFKHNGIRLKDESFACLKHSSKEIEQLRKELFEMGIYDDSAFPLITDGVLNKYLAKDHIMDIVALCGTYEGPDGYKITEFEVNNFLKQFMACCSQKDNVKTLLNGIKDLLLGATHITRRVFVETFVRKLKEKPLSQYNICNVGHKLDSAAHLQYYLNDVQQHVENIVIVDRLDDWLANANDDDAIIFYDDGSYSGRQIVSIFQEYMGIRSRMTDEEHVTELSDELKAKLRNKKIVLFFICFNKKNVETIVGEFREMGLDNVDICYGDEMDTSLFDQQHPIVKDTLKAIGEALVSSAKGGKENWDAKRIQDAALGYNDARQMVFLKSSVPTYTITCFWLDGCIDNRMKWIPLFQRTNKPL
ncbi:MAG: HD domain-containing protein [Clostridia bacterium]|nr:HD domain-containing protein [Clostridia bacterium]